LLRLGHRSLHNPVADGNDKARLLGHGNEDIRQQQAFCRVIPAQQRLGSGYAFGLYAALRLVKKFQLA
jgi:hypothetical protein